MKNLVINLDEDRKRILENAISLYILQGLNYILPLITMPYLVRVLGPEKFGLISFSQAFIQYFVILTDYGFNLSATREISINRENKAKVSEIFSAVMIIKFFLLFVSFIIMSIIVFSFERFRKDWIVYYLTFGIVIGQVLFPVWFFQGMERMKYITGLNAVSKIFFTVTIFIFVHKSSDYIYVPLINSLGFLIAGILSMWFIFKNFNIFPYLPKMSEIKYQLSEGWYVFVSTVAYNLYNNSPRFFIGIFIDNKSVAYFSVAEKIINIFRQLINTILQVFYPYLVKIYAKSFKIYARTWLKLFKFSLVVSILLYISITSIPEKLFISLFHKDFLVSLYILKILAISLILQTLMNLFGMQSMLLLGFTKAYGLSYLIFSFLFLLILPLIMLFSKEIFLIVWLILFTEIGIIFYRIIFLYKKGVLHELFKY